MKLPFKLPQLPHNTQKRNRVGGLLIGVTLAVVFSLLYLAGPLRSFESFDLDFKFKIRQSIRKPPVNKDIVYLEIDNETLIWENTFPDDPLYYVDFIKQLGTDQTGALAVAMCFDYARPFGRKVDGAESDVLLENVGKISNIFNEYAGAKNNIFLNLDYYKELLSGPDGVKALGDISTNIAKFAKGDDIAPYMESLDQIGPYLSSIDYNTLAPYREGKIADAMKNAKNVYFTYEAKPRLRTPFTADDLRNNRSIREIFLGIVKSPTTNRPENVRAGLVYDAYMNLKSKDFDTLLKPGPNAFEPAVVAKLKRNRRENAAQENEFLLQNKNMAFKTPPGIERIYKQLRQAKPVTPKIGRLSAGQGFTKAEFNAGDGTLRMIAPMASYDKKLYPHIDLLLAMKYLGVKPENVVIGKDKIVLKGAIHPRTKVKKDIVIPLENGNMLINWVGQWADTTTFPHLNVQYIYAAVNRLRLYKIYEHFNSLSETDQQAYAASLSPEDTNNLNLAMQVAKDITPAEAAEYEKKINTLKGKIILVGRTATGYAEINPTPLEPRFHMLGLHANAINTIIEDVLIYKPNRGLIVLVFFVLAVSLGLIGGMVHTKSSIVTALINFFVMLIVGGVYIAACILLFANANIDMPLMTPVALIVLTFILVFLFRFLTEEADKKKMQGMFSTYVNKEVVESLIDNPDKLKLGGEWMNCTVFFSDVAGFTSISEALKPEELVELLNEYLTAMTDIIFTYGGTLDKYIGDAIVAVYGAPIPFENHAINACMATIEMQEKLAQMRVVWKEQGRHELTARCGINTGQMIAGNMGSTNRFNYTVIGHNVELGEHLESGGKTFGTIMSISEETYRQAKDHIIVRWVDIIEYHGHDRPFRIFELLAKKTVGISEEKKKGVEIFEAALELHFKRQFKEAIEMFKEVYNYIPNDEATKQAIKHSEEAIANPPGPEFDDLLKNLAPL